MAFVASIELPDSILVRSAGEGKSDAVNLDLTKVPSKVLADIIKSGATVILNNTFNGGGKDREAVDKMAALMKRIDSWYGGAFVMIERGESQYTAMRDQYADEQKAKFGRTRAEVDKVIKATVAEVFGKDKAATFANFLEAVAVTKRQALIDSQPAGSEGVLPTVLEIREEIEKALAERTEAAAAARAKVASSLKMPADLGL